MTDAILDHRAPEDAGNVVLHEEVAELAGTVLPGERQGHAGKLVGVGTGWRGEPTPGKEECPRLPEATPDIA